MGKIKWIVSAVLAAGLVAAGVGWFLIRPAMATAASCEKIRATTAAQGEVVNVDAGSRKVAVLGDSYSSGDGLDDRSQVWALELGKAMRWDTSVAGVGMTGFINGGYCGGQSFGERMPKVLALHPEALIIEGGLNDWKSDGKEIELAAGLLLEQAKNVQTVIVIGPTNAPERTDLSKVDAALAAAAAKHQRQYISALSWELEFLPDRLHLTPAGHKRFAELVAASIR